MRRFRTAGRGHHPWTAIAIPVAATLVAGACSSSLMDEEPSSLDAWPDREPAGEATTPVHPDIRLAAQPVVRTPDGLATLTLEVRNRSNEDVTAGDLLSYSENVPSIRLYDPEGNVRFEPLSVDHDVDSGYCLCSSSSATIPAGEDGSLYATYEGLSEDAEAVRLQASRFTLVDDLPVEDAGGFEVAPGRPTPLESEPGLQVSIESVTRHPEGTLVTARYINTGRNEPVDVDEFPDPGALSVASADGEALYLPRTADDDDVATDLSEQDDLPRDESVTVEALVADMPDDVEAVTVRAPGMRRTLPAPVTEAESDPEPSTFAVPRNLDDAEIRELASPATRFDAPMVPTAAADLPDVEQIGAELPRIDVTGTLTSEAQPEWSISVRGVVRGPGPLSTLLVDLERGDVFPRWPEAVGVDGDAGNLGSLAVIDPEADTRYGVLTSGSAALSAGTSWTPGRDSSMPAYALLPGLDPDTSSVTVDVPSFGTVEDVPVVDGPTGPAEGDVPASMRVRGNDDLRMDVLTVSHLGDGNGTLARARLVNEADPSAVETTFAQEGSDDLCDLVLYDPATGNRYPTLDPCVATTWSDNLAAGEQLVYEVRFPELPADIGPVTALASGYLPSGPVDVVDGEQPWYLALPAPAGDPSGSTFVASVGTADRGETTTRREDTVEVVLETDVLFEFDSADLTGDAEDRITSLAGDIADAARPGSVTITGHTDDVGTEDYNQGLSEDRAQAVREVLESGIDRSDLSFEVSGEGAGDPVAPNEIDGRDNPDGRARNRRVEIVYEAR